MKPTKHFATAYSAVVLFFIMTADLGHPQMVEFNDFIQIMFIVIFWLGKKMVWCNEGFSDSDVVRGWGAWGDLLPIF